MPIDWLRASTGDQAGPTLKFRDNVLLRVTQATHLPPRAQDEVPLCAQDCLGKYMPRWRCEYNDFGCLCSKYDPQGFTLGELALACVKQNCEQVQDDLVEAYHICSRVEQAVVATHSTITVPPTAPTAYPSRPSRATQDSRGDQAPTTATAQLGPPSTLGSAACSGSRTTNRPLDKPVYGSSNRYLVACMGAVVLAIGIFYLVICMRRRKVKVRNERDERNSYDFVDEAPPRFSPFHYGHADPRGPLRGFYGKRVEMGEEKRNSTWYHDQFLAEPAAKFEKGVHYSPKSVDNRSTMSQLLPDKPQGTPPRIILKQSPRSPSVRTAATVFEEDRSPELPSAPLPLGLPAHPKAFHYPRVTRPPRAKYADQFTQSPISIRQPSLSIEIPKQAPRLVKSPVPAHVPVSKPLPRSPARLEERASTGSRARSSRSGASILNYYASPEADTYRSPDSPTPIDDEMQRRRVVPTAITVTKPTYYPRAVRITSAASDTSFESTDPDEPTPPDENGKPLSPVREHSPIAGIKYPKVPRSSNQSIPRSPPTPTGSGPFRRTGLPATNATPRSQTQASPRQLQIPAQPAVLHSANKAPRPTSHIPRKPVPSHQYRPQHPVTPERQINTTSDLSGSTLAAKRRGDTAAHDLDQNLYITDPSQPRGNISAKSSSSTPQSMPASKRSPHSSPLKGYGRVASKGSPVVSRPSGQGPQSNSKYSATTGRGGGQAKASPGGGSHFHGQEAARFKSPPWEPKLTPSRKGEDLYLQVGVATPRTAAFGFEDERSFRHGGWRS